jgi:hypothetical protein
VGRACSAGWDGSTSSFALFRTYVVPSIGGLLARTGEFTGRTQKRYDDTVLILDAVLEHGPASCPVPHPREAIATPVHRSPERAG